MFTKEELESIYELVKFASQTISSDDEPLLDDILEKLNDLINNL